MLRCACEYADSSSHTRPCAHITQRDNDLDAAGIEKIAGALERMAGLQELYLVRTGGGGEMGECGMSAHRPMHVLLPPQDR